MSKRIRENAFRILKSIYYMEDPKKITQDHKKNKVSGDEFIDTMIYLKKKGLVNYEKLEIPMEVSLTDKGMDFVISELRENRQEEFNRIIAFTGAILTLIGIYTFFNEAGLINEQTKWLKVIFVLFIVIALGPIIAFIINSYTGKK